MNVKAFDYYKDGRSGWYLYCDLGNFDITPGDKAVQITYNGKTFELPITYRDDLGVVLANTYLIDGNGTKYIWVCNTVGNDMHDTNVYKIGDNDITLVGVAESVSFPTITTTEVMNGFESGGMGIMRASREYKVGDDGMPSPLNDIRTFDTSLTYKMAFVKDFKANIISNGEVTSDTITIKKYNEYVTLLETDGNTYLDVETEAGVVARIDFSKEYKLHYDQFQVDIFYEGIMESIMDWKEPWL